MKKKKTMIKEMSMFGKKDSGVKRFNQKSEKKSAMFKEQRVRTGLEV
jgi:hypothetical protein